MFRFTYHIVLQGSSFLLYLNEHSSVKSPTPVTTPTSGPAFLSRFPRSLSQLNLGAKKKATPPSDVAPPLPSLEVPATDQPPPLPQRNVRKDSTPDASLQISDLDASHLRQPSGVNNKSKKKPKAKIKALSDPGAPPLPPRTPGGTPMDVRQGQDGLQPNSCNTLMNYPLVSTCQAVRAPPEPQVSFLHSLLRILNL